MTIHDPTPTRFAPVAPVHILQELCAAQALGDYHLFLAHHTVEKPKEFTDLFDAYFKQNDRRVRLQPTIIMDNSLVELGGAVDDAMIQEAVGIIRRGTQYREIIPVLPDVMGDGLQTRMDSVEGYERWNRKGMGGNSWMLVTQGKDWEDFVALIDYFFVDNLGDYPKIGWVGIPRWITNNWPEATRARALRYIKLVAPQVKVHLLGFSNDIVDDLFCSAQRGVTGIDSAVPVRYNGLLHPLTTDDQIGPRGDWWEKGMLSTDHLRNLANVRKWIRSY